MELGSYYLIINKVYQCWVIEWGHPRREWELMLGFYQGTRAKPTLFYTSPMRPIHRVGLPARTKIVSAAPRCIDLATANTSRLMHVALPEGKLEKSC